VNTFFQTAFSGLFDTEEILDQDGENDREGEGPEKKSDPIGRRQSPHSPSTFLSLTHLFVSKTTSSKVRIGQKKLHQGV
jgi:hypothetical protein